MLASVIARIWLVLSLALLVAAPAQVLAGAAQAELIEEAASAADDEAVVPAAFAHAAVSACAVGPERSDAVEPPAPGLARVFRPPRAGLARA
jgi:hypothetical protein